MTDTVPPKVESVARALAGASTAGVKDPATVLRIYARAAIEAHETALADAGLVIVPREPTEAMLRASRSVDYEEKSRSNSYRAMIRAALEAENRRQRGRVRIAGGDHFNG